MTQPRGSTAPSAPGRASSRTIVGGAVRTALAVEPRDGILCVFMPPVETARGLSRAARRDRGDARARPASPVHIEGYPPPHDPRLNVIKVTPDPGVIEVNVHPAASWREAVDDHRRRSTRKRGRRRLGTDKFMIDGRHTGTGGGNHVVLGGATPADTPVPAPARPAEEPRRSTGSAIPSLSYLFSGLFIGPTSQAPRIDEARHDALYELEIALAQVPEPGDGDAAALAGRPAVPQPPGRRHRQHPPRRDLHRQALLAGRPDRPARPGRVPRASRCRRTRA